MSASTLAFLVAVGAFVLFAAAVAIAFIPLVQRLQAALP